MNDTLDESLLTELQDVMEDDFGVLLETYLTESVAQFERVREDRANGDTEALRRSAHSLKGSCANVGAVRSAALCQNIESSAAAGQLDGLDDVLLNLSSELDQVRQLLKARL